MQTEEGGSDLASCTSPQDWHKVDTPGGSAIADGNEDVGGESVEGSASDMAKKLLKADVR